MQPRWTKEDLALAYELRTLGYQFKYIAKGLGGHHGSLKAALYRAIKRGVL